MKISKSSHPSSSCMRYIFLVFFFLFLFVVAFFLILGFCIIFELQRRGIIQLYNNNNNFNIIAPKGKVLYNVGQYHYRNQSLYRYKDQYFLTDRHPPKTSVIHVDENDDDEVIVFHSVLHNEGEKTKNLKCEGVCECYEDDDEDYNINDRKFSSLIYSYRYSSMVVVSALGFAVSRFIDKNIESCYIEARKVLKKKRVSCFIDTPQVSCWDMQDRPKKDFDDDEWVQFLYECNGHCLENMRIKNPLAQAVIYAQEFECEKYKTGPTEVEVVLEWKDRNTAWRKAAGLYKTHHLVPFCKHFYTQWNKPLDYGCTKWQWTDIYPCVAEQKGLGFSKNIECFRIHPLP